MYACPCPSLHLQALTRRSPLFKTQAFYLARTGRPGPVLVDVPKDIQQQLGIPDWDTPMAISGYMSRLPPPPEPAQLAAMLKALKGAKKPVSSAQQQHERR
jgi:acetolactate synthase-1/2/3 large subunit